MVAQICLELVNGADETTAEKECTKRAIGARRRTSELEDVVQRLQSAIQDTFQKRMKMKAASP